MNANSPSRRITASVIASAFMLAGVMNASTASAATEDAWEAFRADVSAQCLAAGAELFETVDIIVDPFGSPSYGMALLRGKARGANVTIMAICVYDKATQTAEIGGELPDIATFTELAWTYAFTSCDAACETVLAGLTANDADVIQGLADRVEQTIAATEALPADAWAPEAREVLNRVRDLQPGGDLAAVTTGERNCTVYWYGFLENGGQVVGEHQCRIELTDEGLTVTKLTGEMLRADIVPAGGGYALAIGRTFIDDQPERAYDRDNPDNAVNPNFGNYAGLAFVDGDALFIIDADMHGFEQPDATYFSVLVIE